MTILLESPVDAPVLSGPAGRAYCGSGGRGTGAGPEYVCATVCFGDLAESADAVFTTTPQLTEGKPTGGARPAKPAVSASPPSDGARAGAAIQAVVGEVRSDRGVADGALGDPDPDLLVATHRATEQPGDRQPELEGQGAGLWALPGIPMLGYAGSGAPSG